MAELLMELPNEILLLIFHFLNPQLDEILNVLTRVNNRFRSLLMNSTFLRNVRIPPYWSAYNTSTFLQLPVVAPNIQSLDTSAIRKALKTRMNRHSQDTNGSYSETTFSFLPTELVFPSLRNLILGTNFTANDLDLIRTLCPNLDQLTIDFQDNTTSDMKKSHMKWEAAKQITTSLPRLHVKYLRLPSLMAQELLEVSSQKHVFPLEITPEMLGTRRLEQCSKKADCITSLTLSTDLVSSVTILEGFPNITSLDMRACGVLLPEVQDSFSRLSSIRQLTLRFEGKAYGLESIIHSFPFLESLSIYIREPQFEICSRYKQHVDPRDEVLLTLARNLVPISVSKRQPSVAGASTDCTSVSKTSRYRGSVIRSVTALATHKKCHLGLDATLKELRLFKCAWNIVRDMLCLISGTGVLNTLELSRCDLKEHELDNLFKTSLSPVTWSNFRHVVLRDNPLAPTQRLLVELSAAAAPLESLHLDPEPASLKPFPKLKTLRTKAKRGGDWDDRVKKIVQMYPRLEILDLSPWGCMYDGSSVITSSTLDLCLQLQWLHTLLLPLVKVVDDMQLDLPHYKDEIDGIDYAKKVHGRWMTRFSEDMWLTYCPRAWRIQEYADGASRQWKEGSF